MKLSMFLRPLDADKRERLALDAGTTSAHLRNVAFSSKPCGIHLAVGLESLTDRAVRRWDLRPDDWHRIWPELIGAEGAPGLPAAEAAEVRDAA